MNCVWCEDKGFTMRAYEGRDKKVFCTKCEINHNHVTRDIKERGKCPVCDRYHDSVDRAATLEGESSDSDAATEKKENTKT